MKNYNYKVSFIYRLFFPFFFLFYKVYLSFIEENFIAFNAKNIIKIEAQPLQDINFAVVGNIKNSISIFEKKIIPMLNNKDIDFVISLGNAVASNGEDKYRLFYKSTKLLQSPLLNVVGVNECSMGNISNYYKHFGPLFFSFEKNDNMFIFFDSTGETAPLYMKQWIYNLLKNNAHKKIYLYL